MDAILPDNPAQEWLAELQAPESEDPIGGKLHIDMEKPGEKTLDPQFLDMQPRAVWRRGGKP